MLPRVLKLLDPLGANFIVPGNSKEPWRIYRAIGLARHARHLGSVLSEAPGLLFVVPRGGSG